MKINSSKFVYYYIFVIPFWKSTIILMISANRRSVLAADMKETPRGRIKVTSSLKVVGNEKYGGSRC